MPVIAVTAGGSKVELADGTYPVQVSEVIEDTIENPQFGNGDVVRIILLVDGVLQPDGEETHLDAIANMKLTPKSKLWGWVTAFGLELVVGSEFDTDALVGRSALARIENDVKEDGSTWPRVRDIFPAVVKPAAGSLTKPDGKPDYNAFWARVKAIGKTKADVDALAVSVPGRSVAELEAVLARLGKAHEHDWAYTDDGKDMICRSCGAKETPPA